MTYLPPVQKTNYTAKQKYAQIKITPKGQVYGPYDKLVPDKYTLSPSVYTPPMHVGY